MQGSVAGCAQPSRQTNIACARDLCGRRVPRAPQSIVDWNSPSPCSIGSRRRCVQGSHLCKVSNSDEAGGSSSSRPNLQPDEHTASTSYEAWRAMPPRMVAAMALSPLAALSLPLVQNEKWATSAREFGQNLRARIQTTLSTDGFQRWVSDVDESITFMDWTARWTGIDLRYMWDPELWIKFKEAVWADAPQIFYNKLAERIEYKGIIPQAGIAGDMRISYGKFLQLLESDRIKRVVVYGDMKTAVVEVPHPWYASVVGAPGTYPFVSDRDGKPISLLIRNPNAPNDPASWYCPEMPEWSMEKYRFYLDLPGDFWESGALLRYLRSKDVQIVWDAETGQYVLPHKAFTKVFQVRTEVTVLDPSANWDFFAWLTTHDKLEFYEKAAAVCLFCRLLSTSLDWATGTPIWKKFTTRKKKKKSKQESMWERLTKSTAREFMTKDAKTGKMRDTGVRFEDIAGLDHIVIEMREIVKMLLNDPAYAKVGAKVPRGVIFQGPPGTGKTYLARAIAGEAGVPFFSAVGSEFVEMFAGIAAARVNNLFVTARRKAPAIIFIDEIDAIGRARSTLGSDPGSMERESALLAMLVQMDGIHGKLESVLTIGATNLAQELDGALLRPGRFEVVYEIPSPGPVARMEILRYHAKNKKLSGDGLLTRVAEATQGWSAASLANLMNEAAILTVRRNQEKITLPLVMELVEGINWGSRAPKIPPSEAKNRLAVVTAAKAVAFAVTPGMEKIKSVTLWTRKRGLGPAVDFEPSQESLDVAWHPEMVEVMDWSTNLKVNASTIGDERLGEFLHVAGLLVPLYSPRVAEVMMYGEDAASLATAPPISDCFEIAYWCVRNSNGHPRFKSMPPLHTFLWLGSNPQGQEERDPLNVGFDIEFGYHALTLTLLKASWRRAQRLVATHRTAILKVAEEMLAAQDEQISGTRLVEIIEGTPLDDAPADLADLGQDFMPILKEVLGQVPGVIIEGAEAAARTLDVLGKATEPTSTTKTTTTAVSEEQTPAAAAVEGGVGRIGMVSFRSATDQPTSGADTGRAGSVGFQLPTASSSSTTPVQSSNGPSGGDGAAGGEVTALAGGRVPPPEVRLTEQQLMDVSRAIMGRLDIVDLVGKNTAMEAAERIRDALLDPETVQRLQAVRRYVEQDTAPFPPAPLAKDVPLPRLGAINGNLEYWKQRQIRDISWSAIEMLYNERQMKYFKQDADWPREEDTSQYKKRQKEKQEQEQAKAQAASPSDKSDV